MSGYNQMGFRQLLTAAKSGGYAVGAFNIVNYPTAKAVIEAAEELRSPAILQTSVGTVRAFGAAQLFQMIQSLRRFAEFPVLLHLDHCRDLRLLRECVDVGWDSVMLDGSALPFEENVRMTREARDYAKKHGVDIEAEIGVIGGQEEEIKAGQGAGTNYEDAMRFLNETRVDALAPAIGTAHGIYKTAAHLNYDLLKRLADTAGAPIVVHGGTGLSSQQFSRLVDCGAAKINISTAIKHAYLDGAKRYLAAHPEDYVPLDMDAALVASVRDTVKAHLKDFRSCGKA